MNTNGNPAVLYDGIRTDFSVLQTLRANEVAFLDVIYPDGATIFGSLGGGGVIAVYSMRGMPSDLEPIGVEQKMGRSKTIVSGFHKSRQYYTPAYPVENPEKPDYRTTLMWEPNLLFDDNGKSVVPFATGDLEGNFIVHVEGMTKDGSL